MAQSLIVPLLLLLATAPPLRGGNPQDPDQLIAHALELQRAGDMLGAIDTYKKALVLSPDRADALSNMGAAYVRLGQFDDAIRHYEAALQLDPTAVSVRTNLALAYYKSARPDRAIPQLRQVLAGAPDARNVYLLLADCYLQTGRDEELITLLKPREQMFGSDDLAYAFLLGTALLHTGAVAEGQKYVDRVFGRGDSAEAHLLLGTAHLARHDYRDAKTELERALRLNPKLTTANALHGRALLALGEQEQAERAFRAELDGNINDFEANLQLGNLRKSAGRFEDASVYLERATTIRPNDLTARKLLASLRLQTGKVEEALTMLEAIVAEAPEMVDVHVQLATAYNRLKRKDDAERERAIIDRLNREAQAKQPGGVPDAGNKSDR